jgi:predicted esterase
MNEVEIKHTMITSEIPMTYHHLNQGPGKPLLLFFHGYSDSARSLLRRAFPSLDEKYEILAINGLFPVPQKKDNEWKQAFAWYFADFESKSVLIPPEISAKAVVHLIEKLGLVNRPKIVLGFSQGGFFIPFVLPQLKEIRHIFAMGAAYREENYHEVLKVPMDALHGVDDEVISFESAEKSFKNFVKHKNPKGEFKSFAGLKHTMNDESREWLKAKIDQVFR